jgi:hypothetical protein
VSTRSEHLGVVEASIGAIGWTLAGVDEQVCERVVRRLVLVVEGDVALVDDDEVGLALAVMTEGTRATVVGVETGCIANVEVEQFRVTGVGRIDIERIRMIARGGVDRGVLWVVGGVFSCGFRAGKYRGK